MPDTAALLSQILAFRDARNWQQFHKPKDVAISLALEAAEVLEHFQWKNERDIEEYLKTHSQDVGEELVDVLYWTLLLFHELGLDIESAFKDKMRKNEDKYPVEKARDRHQKYDVL